MQPGCPAKNHDNPAKEPLDSSIIPSQNGPFTQLVRGKIGYDFKSLKSFQKKDEHSEMSRSVGAQTEETRIRRKKRSPYTQEEIEKGLQLLLSSTIARTETWLHIHFLLPFRRDDGLPTPSENYHCYRKGCSTTLMYINQWKALFVVTGADSLNTRS